MSLKRWKFSSQEFPRVRQTFYCVGTEKEPHDLVTWRAVWNKGLPQTMTILCFVCGGQGTNTPIAEKVLLTEVNL